MSLTRSTSCMLTFRSPVYLIGLNKSSINTGWWRNSRGNCAFPGCCDAYSNEFKSIYTGPSFAYVPLDCRQRQLSLPARFLPHLHRARPAIARVPSVLAKPASSFRDVLFNFDHDRRSHVSLLEEKLDPGWVQRRVFISHWAAFISVRAGTHCWCSVRTLKKEKRRSALVRRSLSNSTIKNRYCSMLGLLHLGLFNVFASVCSDLCWFWLGAEGLDFCPSVCVCLLVVGLNGTAAHLQASLPKLRLITTCSLWLMFIFFDQARTRVHAQSAFNLIPAVANQSTPLKC